MTKEKINFYSYEEFIKEFVSRSLFLEEEEEKENNKENEFLGDYNYNKYNNEED